ncbi:hypothetical protein GH714_011346 [Hevea brasiliensis]|uniref:Methionine gamma-lyase n=1 Tax=Hevea brasiliensis TaxID=3981 RepID=A0A6A6MIG6_HEVBR|nr:hypothetical protein GH714_011346 [Hevea brasiliensis]
MAHTKSHAFLLSGKKRPNQDEFDGDDLFLSKKSSLLSPAVPYGDDPVAALAAARHEFGEHGGVNMSIEASATFTVMEPDTMRRMFSGELGPDRDFFIYSRHFNPTVLNLGRQMAALEGTEAAYCTASGRLTSIIFFVRLILVIRLQELKGLSLDRYVCDILGVIATLQQWRTRGGFEALYGGTHALLSHFLPRACNITTTFVEIGDVEMVKNAIVEGKTKVFYFESMSNPTLTVANIPELSRIAHEKGVMVVVDNTFAPVVLSPARLGADVVVHSISKFISGGADIIAGAVCGPASLVNSMMDLHQGTLMLLGPTMNAKKLGLKVNYPGLEDHPQHELLKSMANKDYGYGALLCLDMETEERANRLMQHLQNFTQFGLMAVSLGYYETLMSVSGSSTSSEMSAEEKKLAGISPGLIRMSVGYIGTLEQKWSQFEKALLRMQDSGFTYKNSVSAVTK